MSRDFRTLLVKTYHRCALSGLDSLECDGAHLVPQAICYKLSLGDLAQNPHNGILLSKSLHSSFDRNLWCLDIYDIRGNISGTGDCLLPVIVKKNRQNYSINQYEGKLVRVPVASLPFFWIRYQLFVGLNYEIHTNYNELEFYRKHISSIEYIEIVKNPHILEDWVREGGPGGLRGNRKRFAESVDLPIRCLIDHHDHNHKFLALFHYKSWGDMDWLNVDEIPENLLRQYRVLREKMGDPDW